MPYKNKKLLNQKDKNILYLRKNAFSNAFLRYILLVSIVFFMVVNIQSSENILNSIFFDDFKKIGMTVLDNFSSSVVIFSFTFFTSLALINNDNFLKDKVDETHNDFNDKFFEYINYGGDAVYVMAFNSIFFLFSEKEKRTAKNTIECLIVNGIINYSLKTIIGRKRPSQTENPRDFDLFTLSDNSMPSGHTMVAFSWAEVLNNTYGIWYITYPLSALVGYARVYKSSHWVSDVFIGGLLGVVLTKIILSNKKDLQLSLNFDKNLTSAIIKYNF